MPDDTKRTRWLLLRARWEVLRMGVLRRLALFFERVARRLEAKLRAAKSSSAGRAEKRTRADARRKDGLPAWQTLLERLGNQETVRALVAGGLFGRTLPRVAAQPAGRRILVLAAHQDDEAVGAGGTLLRAASHGKRIHIVYYTDGATSVGNLPLNVVPEVRRREAERAWRGVPGVSLSFLGYPNRGSDEVCAEGIRELVGLIRRFRPDAVFVPSFLEEVREHNKMSEWLARADAASAIPAEVEVWGYQITTRIAGNTVVDITDLWRQKYRLNRHWRSQNAYIDYAHLAMGQDIANSYYLKGGGFLKPTAAYAEVFLRFPAREYLELCRRFFALPGGEASGDRQAGMPAPPFSGEASCKARPESHAAGAGPARGTAERSSVVAGRTGEPDFFIVGTQKAGSYWLTALLDAHPEVRCFPSRPGHADGSGEAHLFDHLAKLDADFGAFRKGFTRKLGGFFADLVPEDRPGDEGGREALVRRICKRFGEYCRMQRQLAGKPVVGEKTTETVHYPDLLAHLFPGVRKICILRDPRDRAVSFHYHQIRKGRLPEGAPLGRPEVEAYVERVRRDYEGLLATEPPVHLLTYEQLSSEPVPTCRRMLEFLGVAHDEQTAKEMLAAASFERLADRPAGDEDRGSHFRKGVVGDWRETLPVELARQMVQQLDDVTRALERRFDLDLSGYRAFDRTLLKCG